MAFWLLKSEPDTFSLDDLKKKNVAGWDGVRNYQARNFLRAMKVGDQAFFYHSNAQPSGIVGLARIVRAAYPDPTQFDPNSDYYDAASTRDKPRWDQVDVQFENELPRFISLDEIRGTPNLQNMMLLRHSRLSVQPVSETEVRILLDLAKK